MESREIMSLDDLLETQNNDRKAKTSTLGNDEEEEGETEQDNQGQKTPKGEKTANKDECNTQSCDEDASEKPPKKAKRVISEKQRKALEENRLKKQQINKEKRERKMMEEFEQFRDRRMQEYESFITSFLEKREAEKRESNTSPPERARNTRQESRAGVQSQASPQQQQRREMRKPPTRPKNKFSKLFKR